MKYISRAIGFALAAMLCMTCFGQAPKGWTNDLALQKKMGDDTGKWYANQQAKGVEVMVVEKRLALPIGDLDEFLKPFSMNIANTKSRVLPKGIYPCIGFIGTTSDNFPTELYIVITPEHAYSVCAVTFTLPNDGGELPSKSGFVLADWLTVISSDKPMSAAAHAKFETELARLKAIFDGVDTLETPAVLVEVANIINKTCPLQVDRETRFDVMIPGPGKRLSYRYTMILRSAGDPDLKVMLSKTRPTLVNRYKTDPEMASLRKHNIELHHDYYDKDGKHIGEIVVSPKDF